MHLIEPYYKWRNLYVSEEDYNSPFFEREYSEMYYSNTVYNYYIHPQWDYFGSSTLFMKIIFCDYDEGYTIIELIGEWNDCLYNDIMTLKREIIDHLISQGINKFILIGENVMNFHGSDDCYYEEWVEDIEEGWIIMLNFLPHVIQEMYNQTIQNYIHIDVIGSFSNWRTFTPDNLYEKIKTSLKNTFEEGQLVLE